MRTVFLGTSEFAAVVLERLAASPHRPALVISRPDAKRGRERFQVVVKTTEREPAIAAVASAVEGAARDRSLRDVAFSVDVDPQ